MSYAFIYIVAFSTSTYTYATGGNSIAQLHEQCVVWDGRYTHLDLVESPHSRSFPIQQWLEFIYSDVHGVQSTHNVTLQLKYRYMYCTHVKNQ